MTHEQLIKSAMMEVLNIGNNLANPMEGNATTRSCGRRLVALGEQMREAFALLGAGVPAGFVSEEALLQYLESLHESPNGGGTICNRKWEPAQRAAKAIREGGTRA